MDTSLSVPGSYMESRFVINFLFLEILAKHYYFKDEILKGRRRGIVRQGILDILHNLSFSFSVKPGR